MDVKTSPKTQLWGLPLEEAARRSDPDWIIPAPISCSVAYLLGNELYLREEGIFRVPGYVGRVNELKNLFNKGLIPDFQRWEVENATSVILNFLKIAGFEANDDPFTGPGQMRAQFVEGNATDDVALVKSLLKKQSLSKRETLRLLAYLFLKIEEQTQHNKMTIFTLCVSFGAIFARAFPILVRNYKSVFPNTIVFGVSFEEACQRGGALVPTPISVSLEFIQASGYGLGEDGELFMKCDSQKRTCQYKYEFNSGHDVTYFPGDIHCAATIIHWFLSECGSSLCLNERFEKEFMDLMNRDKPFQLARAQEILSQLPLTHSYTLCFLSKHLSQVAMVSSQYGITQQALCGSFGSRYSSVLSIIIDHIAFLAKFLEIKS